MSRDASAEPERLAARAAVLLARSGAWLDTALEGYAVRLSPDRRRRAALAVDEAAFRALVRSPGLRPLPEGGWRALVAAPQAATPAPGRPGVTLGERTVVEADGRLARRTGTWGRAR